MSGDESRLESDSEQDPDSEPEEIRLDEPSKKAIFKKEGLLEKLKDISWPEPVEWLHKLSLDHDHGQDIDVNDDISREMAFYNQALQGTREAFTKLKTLGIPFLRPPDYYAEMVKTDSHMLKVKGKLLVKKQQVEEAEERKKARESKKIAKEVQAQKLKERAKAKKEEIESVKRWRKQRQRGGYAGGKDRELGLEFDKGFSNKRRPGVAPGDRSGGFRGKFKKNPRREHRDLKFGSGGRKGMKKQNTADTTNDFRDFNRGGDNPRNKRRRK